MQNLYVELVSRISGYTTPLRQAAAATRATTAEISRDLKALDDRAIAGFRSVAGSLAKMDEEAIASFRSMKAGLADLDEKVITGARAQGRAWQASAAETRAAATEIKASMLGVVDASRVASKASIRAAADQARALRNEAAALPRGDAGRQQLYLQARAYEDQSRELNRMRQDSIMARRAVADVAMVTGGILVAGMGAGVVAAAHLQTQMANVATISDALNGKVTMSGQVIHDASAQVAAARHNWDTMTNAVVQMSTELPQSALTLTKSLYDIVSSGFDGADALTILRASAVAASAGLTTTADSTKAIVAVLNAFGLSAASATDVSDIMFQTVNKGVISYEELAHSLGMYAAMAATAGGTTEHTTKSFAEAEAALAAMTLAGVPAEQAATGLNRVYTQLLHPSEALTGAFKDMGFQSGQQAIEVLGLHGVLMRLSKTYGSTASAALKLFPEIRAARGYMAATANEGENYRRTFEAITNVTNRAAASQKALEKQQGTASYQMTILKNSAVALGIDFGRTVLPAVQMLEHVLGGFVSMVQHIPGPLRDVIGVLALVAGAVLLFGGMWMAASAKIEAFQARMEAATAQSAILGRAMTVSTIGLGVLGAAALVASLAFGVFEGHQQKVKALTDELTAAMSDQQGAMKGTATTAAITNQLVQGGLIDNLVKAGYTVPQAVANIQKGGDAYRQMLHDVQDTESWFDRHMKSNTSSVGDLSPFGAAAGEKLDAISEAWGKAASKTKDAAFASRENSAATDQATNSLSGLASMTAKTGQGTAQLSDAQQALNTQLDKMVDSSTAAQSALAQLQSPADIFTALSSANVDAAKNAAKSTSGAYNASLKSEVYAAQDRARQLSRAASDASKNEKRAYTERARSAADYARNLSRSASHAKSSTQDFADAGVVSLSQWETGLQHAGAVQSQFDADLHRIAQMGGGKELIDALQGLGIKGVAIARQLADGSHTQVKRINDSFASLAPSAKASIDKWADTLQQELTTRANYLSNLAHLTMTGHGDIVAAIEGITDPAQAAKMAAAAVNASGRQLDRLGKLLFEKTQIAGSDFQNGLDILTSIAASKGKATVKALAAQFTGGDVDQMKLMLAQLKGQITDLGVKHHIQLILDASGPVQPVVVPVIPSLRDLPGVPGSRNDAFNVPRGAGVGGLLAVPVHPQADGGFENHTAQISRPVMRLWAEPETGGEAYIPLSPNKRGRSTAILGEVASRFGMALVPNARGDLLDTMVDQSRPLDQIMRLIRARGGAGAGAPGAPFHGAHGPAQVMRWIKTALGVLNLPDALAPGVMNLIMHESGGNPNAVNRWDINAQQGHPSQGLMQTIPTTFSAYALPGYNRNILDPVSNIIAGVRYAKANYGLGMLMSGGRRDASGNYLGYADGGINDPYPMTYTVPGSGSVTGGSALGGGSMSFTPFLTPSTLYQDFISRQEMRGVKHPHAPSAGQFASMLNRAAHETARWEHNLRIISRKAGTDVAQALADMGAEGERYVTAFAHKSGRQIRSLAHDMGILTSATKQSQASLSSFGSELSSQVGHASRLQGNLMHLASRGFGQLARQIEAIGGPEGERLAALAAHASGKRLRHLAAIVRRGERILTGDQRDEALQIMEALSRHRNYGIHDVAYATGLGEDEIIKIANLTLPSIRHLGKHSAQFRADLAKANKYQPYAGGGYAPPGSGVQWAEAGAGGEWMIPGDPRKRGRAVGLLRHAAGRFGYGLTTTASARPVGTSAAPQVMVVVNVPEQQSQPLIGALSVTTGANASPRAIVDEAFHAARVVRMRRGR